MQKILIVEKFTSFEIIKKSHKIKLISKERLDDLEQSHNNHKEVKNKLIQKLDENNLSYKLIKDEKVCKTDFNKYTHIISLGGDGTFLHAAKNTSNQILIGINTDIHKSEGFLTKFNYTDIPQIITNLIENNFKIQTVSRLGAKINNQKIPYLALNEIVIGNEKIYNTTHIKIETKNKSSRFISNGIVIATQKGSSAFYKSAMGKPFTKDTLGYAIILPFKQKGDLETTNVLNKEETITITPKRQKYSLIFDCDEKRKIVLHQEDKVEVFIDKDDGLRVAIN